MIVYEQICKTYPDGTHALQNINVSIELGQLWAIIGPSGCGKTSFLKLLNRLIEPTAGRILLQGHALSDFDPIDLRRRMGYVIQQVGLFPHMTVEQNISIVPKILGWPTDRQHERSRELLRLIDMDPVQFLSRYPHQLSGGQQQRVGVLRALAADPDVILMDEPFGAVDPLNRAKLQQELKSLHTRLNKTILLVTHDIDEAFLLADRILLLKEGRIVQAGTPDELRQQPLERFVTEYLGASAGGAMS